MMSFGGGWFFLAASEAITVLNRELLLPGVGSFMALAVKAADVRALGWAVVTMVTLILMVDAVVWRPLVAWAEKFKVEESQATDVPTSRLLDLLRRSHLVPWVAVSARSHRRRSDRADRVVILRNDHGHVRGDLRIDLPRRLPESFFLGLLEQHFSAAEARRQLDTAIDWGRYAELFGFEDDTNELFIEAA